MKLSDELVQELKGEALMHFFIASQATLLKFKK
jgi:hypothetical protein